MLVQHRARHIGHGEGQPLMLTDWDAFGYYAYLPAILIYHDYKDLKWAPQVDEKYHVVGGELYQAQQTENGNYAFKYFGGVAWMQLPFFAIAHWLAGQNGYPQDGFSAPYQWAVAIAALFYAMLGLFVLRRVLSRFFNDATIAITLLLVVLATNFMQYAAVDGGQSHVYIFPLYALMILATMQWHKRPTGVWAFAIGYIIGLATMCRPTEAIMLFIPLMWDTHTKEAAKAKWAMVKANKTHIGMAALAGLLGVLPQLLYWKSATNSWVYDVGSAWDFLTPHLRVLFGWEKGWFIYTPVTVFFIVGMLYMRKYPFRKSVLWFCLLNIYIIIAWRDWQYGGSYSTRALMQSYPVFALPLAAFVSHIQNKKWRWGFYVLGIYFIAVNLFQLEQYSKTILHFYDMNRKYYGRIYLNANPTALDYSMLDNEDVLRSTKDYSENEMYVNDSARHIQFTGNGETVLFESLININSKETWIKVDCDIKTAKGIWGAYLNLNLQVGDSVKRSRVRLFYPTSKEGITQPYSFYVEVPPYFRKSNLRLHINRDGDYEGVVEKVKIRTYSK